MLGPPPLGLLRVPWCKSAHSLSMQCWDGCWIHRSVHSFEQSSILHACLQLALEPIWKAYEACEPGADAAGILGKVVKGLGLQHVSLLSLCSPLAPRCIAWRRRALMRACQTATMTLDMPHIWHNWKTEALKCTRKE